MCSFSLWVPVSACRTFKTILSWADKYRKYVDEDPCRA